MERADDLLSMLSAYFKALPFITLEGKENNIKRGFMDTRMLSNVSPPSTRSKQIKSFKGSCRTTLTSDNYFTTNYSLCDNI